MDTTLDPTRGTSTGGSTEARSARGDDPLVGCLLDARYRVVSRLARGGMATVYVALDTRLERTVAVKVMRPALASDPDFVSRFIREARSAARLSHPNAVTVHDQGTDVVDGAEIPWLAMELVEGRTLRDLLRERGRLAPRQAFEVLEPVLAALAAAHRAGLVHRDVKPENVLLADDGRVKVADFGLVRAVAGGGSTGEALAGGSTSAGVLIGTVAYLSPEQVEHGRSDARSDVYSAGVLLFELLTGQKPYDAPTPLQVAYRHVHEDVPAPSSLVPSLPPAVDALVRSATRRDPEARPADAAQLLAAVVAARRALAGARGAGGAGGDDEAADTVVVPAAPPEGAAGGATLVQPRSEANEVVGRTTVEPLPQHATRRRRRWGLVATLLVLLLLLGGGAGGWYLLYGPGAYVTAPGVIGLDEDAARDALAAQGLSLEVAPDGVHHEEVPVGAVVETDPAPSDRVRKDGTVTAVLSLGPERFEVPDLRGSTLEQARQALEERNLELAGEPTEAFSETVPEGEVVSQQPAAGGDPVRRGTPVTLVLSKGREPVQVPTVAGEPVEDARSALQGAGLAVVVEEEHSGSVPRGRVISQAPDDGTLFRGDEVQLTVSLGPPLVTVPDVLDERSDRARQELERAGFRVEVRGTRILDRVLAQSPPSGERAPRGSTIVLTTV